MIADSAMELYQCKLMVLHAASKIDAAHRGENVDFKSEVSMAKHFVANSLNRIIDRAIQTHGALGYSTDTPLAHMYQHARWARFADGADEIHQMRIAQRTIAAYKDHGTTRAATGDLPVDGRPLRSQRKAGADHRRGRGLGREMAQAFAEHGADVIIASRKLDVLEQTAAEMPRPPAAPSRPRRAMSVSGNRSPAWLMRFMPSSVESTFWSTTLA